MAKSEKKLLKIEDTSFGRLVLALEVATEYNSTSSSKLTIENVDKKRHPNSVHLTNLVERYRSLTKDMRLTSE